MKIKSLRIQNKYKATIKDNFMIKAVIFDWIGTLYERGKGAYPDSKETLESLKRGGIKMSLISLSKDPDARKLQIKNSGLESYFDYVIIDREKNATQYFACMHLMNSDNRTTLIVDDRTKRGIKIGTEIFCPTAWIERGDYAHELPNAETGQPTYTIKTVKDILPIVFES